MNCKLIGILAVVLELIVVHDLLASANVVEMSSSASADLVEMSSPASCFVGMSLPASYRPFSSSSPWNVPIGTSPEIMENSDAIIRELEDKAQFLKGDMTEWTIPMFVIDSNLSPHSSVRSLEPLHPSVDPDGRSEVADVPLPKGVWPDPESDGHLLLVDLQKATSWDLSRAKLLENGTWEATRVAIWNLAGSGVGQPFAGERWWTFGARGSGMPLIAGLIRPEEIESGEIRHALACATPINRRALLLGDPKELCSPPAARTDGKLDGQNTLPMGARLQLDPALNLDSLRISPQTKIVAKAMQRYGLYVGDGSPTFKIYFQNLGADKGRWAQISDFSDLANIPIKKFRVLECKIAQQ